MFIYLPNFFRLKYPVLCLVAIRTSLWVSLLNNSFVFVHVMIKVRSFKFLLEYQYLYYILHRSSFKSPTLAGNGASGGKGQQESNGVNNTNGGPTQVLVLISSHWMDQTVISVHIRSSCNILFQGVRNVPQSILYTCIGLYTLCVYMYSNV